MRGAERAAEVRAILGKRPASSEMVCARFRVPVYTVILKGRLRAIYMDGAIGVRIGLPMAERQHLILHELGHHLMHAEIAGARASLDHRGGTLSRIEAEAEEFAYHFTVTDGELARLVADGWDAAAIAAHYGRTVAWVAARRCQPAVPGPCRRELMAAIAALLALALALHHHNLASLLGGLFG